MTNKSNQKVTRKVNLTVHCLLRYVVKLSFNLNDKVQIPDK